jgi:hypothetical protein
MLSLPLETSLFYWFSGVSRLVTNGGKKNILMIQFSRLERVNAHCFYGFPPVGRTLIETVAEWQK